MYYFVDESGNTGLHLFDPDQPLLYYGVLGARANLDVIAEPLLRALRRELGVNRIHSNELGVAKLTTIAGRIEQFSKKNDLGCVDKRDSQRALNVIQAGIHDGDQLGTRPDVGRGMGVS